MNQQGSSIRQGKNYKFVIHDLSTMVNYKSEQITIFLIHAILTRDIKYLRHSLMYTMPMVEEAGTKWNGMKNCEHSLYSMCLYFISLGPGVTTMMTVYRTLLILSWREIVLCSNWRVGGNSSEGAILNAELRAFLNAAVEHVFLDTTAEILLMMFAQFALTDCG